MKTKSHSHGICFHQTREFIKIKPKKTGNSHGIKNNPRTSGKSSALNQQYEKQNVLPNSCFPPRGKTPKKGEKNEEIRTGVTATVGDGGSTTTSTTALSALTLSSLLRPPDPTPALLSVDPELRLGLGLGPGLRLALGLGAGDPDDPVAPDVDGDAVTKTVVLKKKGEITSLTSEQKKTSEVNLKSKTTSS